MNGRVELRLPGIVYSGTATDDDGETAAVDWDDGKQTREFPADLAPLEPQP